MKRGRKTKKKSSGKGRYIVALLFMLFVILCSGSLFAAKGSTAALKAAETPSPSPTATAEPTPKPTPESTPEPTPTPVPMPAGVNVDADGNFQMYGKTFNQNDDAVILAHTAIEDNGELVASVIPAMPNLEAVDLDSCGLSNERCAEIQAANPDVEVIFRVNFGTNYSVRTNVTKVLASKPSAGGTLYDDSVQVLKYCTKVRYLDLGHNENITDFSFVEYMPDLEIAVISMTAPSSLQPFSKCSNLLYLEAGNCGITDVSPLAECTKLKHLNLGTNKGLSDITPIYGLDLLRLWLGNSYSTSVPQEQMDEYNALHPDCEVDNEVGTDGEAYVLNEWKCWQQWNNDDWQYYSYTGGNFPAQRPQGYWKVVYKAFNYVKGDQCYSFSWNDPKYEPFTDDTEPVNTYVVNTEQLSQKWEYPDLNKPENLVALKLEDPPGETISVSKY